MTEESRVEFGVEKASGLYPNANLRVSFDCFWPLGCSDSKRCNEHGSCVAAAQSGGRTFDQGSRPSMTAEASKVNMTKDPDLTLDQRRLAYLARCMDGIGGIDFHATARDLATVFNRPEVGELDYYRAVCVGIDSLRMRKAT